MGFIPSYVAQRGYISQVKARKTQKAQFTVAQVANGSGERKAQKLARHYKKYPWTNPALANAFSDWKEKYGKWAARGLARAAYDTAQQGGDEDAVQEALENYTMTKEFKRQYKDFQQKPAPGLLDQAVEIITKPVTAPYRAVKGAIELDPGAIAGAAFDASPAGLIKQTTEAGIAGITSIPGVKAPARAALTALETPWQEIQGQAMGAVTGLIGPIGDQAQPAKPGSAADRLGVARRNPDVQPTSTGGIALERLIQGEPVDLGEGYIPGGDIKKERERRLREIASVTYEGEKHFLTPGRTVAYAANNAFDIVEPGSIAWDALSGAVDALGIITLDPANVGLTAVSRAGRARNVFSAATDADYQAAGAFKTNVRRWTHGATVEQWGDDAKRGAKFYEWVASLNPRDDFLEFQRRTKWKIPVDEGARMVAENDPAKVREIFEPLAGVVREAPNPFSHAAELRQSLQPGRMWNLRPVQDIDVNMMSGESGALNAVYQHMKNARVPDQKISQVMHDWVSTRGPFGTEEGIGTAFNVMREEMIANGIPSGLAHQATRVWKKDMADASLFHINQIADDVSSRGVYIGDNFLPYDTPDKWIQHASSKVWLPDPREVDKLYARYGRIFDIEGTGFTEAKKQLDRFQPTAGERAAGVAGKSLSDLKYGAWIGKTALTNIQSKFWMPLTLLRGAWTLRVVGDDQLRMAMGGHDSLWNHPVRYFSWLAKVGKHPTEQMALQSLQGQAALGGDIAVLMGDPHASIVDMMRSNKSKRLVSQDREVIGPEDLSHGTSWANNLIQAKTDPVLKTVARALHEGGSLHDVKARFWDNAAGQTAGETLQGMARKRATGAEGLDKFRKDLAVVPELKPIMESPSGSAAYIDHLVDQVYDITGRDPDLIRFLATGEYGDDAAILGGKVSLAGREAIDPALDPTLKGMIIQHKAGEDVARVIFPGADRPIEVPVSDLQVLDTDPVVAATRAHDGVNVDRRFVDYLDAKDPASKPQVIKARSLTDDEKSLYDRVIRSAFTAFMDIPSQKLDRSVLFRQSRWERIEEMMHLADADSQKLFIAVATDEKLPSRTIRGLRDAAKKGKGELNYSEIEELSKGHALDVVHDTLYNLQRRSQFFDAMRLLFPFGEAWKEVLTTWSKIFATRPETIRKFQIGITAANEANPLKHLPGAVAEPYEKQGFFYDDQNTGQSMFNYPWSHLITEAAIGVPVPFAGAVEGLSLATNIVPGIGPVAQVGADALMDRFMSDPKYDRMRDHIFPFGEPDMGHGVIESFFPAWMQKMLTSAEISKEDTRVLNNTAFAILDYRYSVGDENPNAPEREQNAAFNRAFESAITLYRVRGTFQFGAPAAPQPQFLLKAPKGLVIRSEMRDELYRLQQKDPDTAISKFLNRFGEEAFYGTQSMTLTEAYAIPFTKAQVDWARRNQRIQEKLPLVYGFFGPAGKPEDFDYDAYLRSIVRGERDPIPGGAERVRRSNHTLGMYWYDRVRKDMGLKPGDLGTDEEQAYLRKVRDKIREAYPGFRDITFDMNRRNKAIEQLQEAVKDRGITSKKPDLAYALKAYLDARDQAIEVVREDGGAIEWGNPGYRSADRYADLRKWLRKAGRQIAGAYPSFKPVWEFVLEGDVGDEDL